MMKTSETSAKKTWITPQLHVYGAIEELTGKSPVKIVGPGDDFINQDRNPTS